MRVGRSKSRKSRRLSLKRHDAGLKTTDRANRRWQWHHKGKPGLKKLGKKRGL